MQNYNLLNNILKNGAINTVEEFTCFCILSKFDNEKFDLILKTDKEIIATCSLVKMVEESKLDDDASMIETFIEFNKPLPINSKYNNLDEIIEELRDIDKEDEFRRNANKHANLGLGHFFLTYDIDADCLFNLYLKYTPIASPKDEQQIAFEIYYSDGEDAFMEHNYNTHKITRLEIK